MDYFKSGVLYSSAMSETKRGHFCTRMFTLFIWQYFMWCRFDSVAAIKEYLGWSEVFMKDWCCIIIIITRVKVYFYFSQYLYIWHCYMQHNCKVWRMYFWLSKCESLCFVHCVIKGSKSSSVVHVACCFLSDSKPEFGTQNRW